MATTGATATGATATGATATGAKATGAATATGAGGATLVGCLSVAPDFGAAGGVEFFVVGRGIDGRKLALMTGPTASDVPFGWDSPGARKQPE
jgi:hypothetical protein